MITYLLSFVKCAIDFSLFYWMFTWFFDNREYNKMMTTIVIVISSIFLVLINRFEIPWLNTIVGIALSLMLNFILFRAQWIERIIASIVVVLVGVMSELFPILALSTLLDMNISGVMTKTISDAAFNLIGAGCFLVILKIGRRLLNKKHNGCVQVHINTNGWSILFPIISISFVYYTLYSDSYAVFLINNTLFYAVLYIIIVIANVGFFFGETSAEKKNQLQVQYNELKYEQDKNNAILKIQDEHISEMNGLVHDFEAQLNGMKNLLCDKSLDKIVAAQYIDEIKENIQEINRFMYVRSKPLQLILNQINEKCISCGIEFIVDIRFTSFDFMSYPDIFSLFENALDNAVNACLNIEDSTYTSIKLQIVKVAEQVLLQISNTYTKNQGRNKFYLTPRRTKEHGIGLQNIKKVVIKYNGTINVDKKDEFRIMITLPYNSIASDVSMEASSIKTGSQV